MKRVPAGAPHVVIVGGGFGGLYAAKQLGNEDVRVTLIDRRNAHVFQPLLYQVATAALNPSEIAAPIRHVLRHQENTTVWLADVVRVDTAHKQVILTDGECSYDYLIVATGATHSYFGHDDWAKWAPGLKTLEDAVEIRRRVLLAYEAAEREPHDAHRAEWLTFVIVGAGPTGVELAGALSEIAREAITHHDFRHIDAAQERVLLLEGTDRVLPPYPPKLSEKAKRQLIKLGVEVRTNTFVTGIDDRGVWLGAERIQARTVLWAAGVMASPLAKSLDAPLDRAGRVLVRPDLRHPTRDEVFVVGDLAALEQDGKPIPGVAGAAVQGGRHAAKQIMQLIAGKPTKPFHYVDKGSLATIGRAAAVADFGKVKLSGWLAWMAWLFIHIMLLIGFRNKIVTLIQWMWAYVAHGRGAKLITGPVPQALLPPHDPDTGGEGKGSS